MIINGKKFKFVDTIPTPITVPDCWVVGSNKLGEGHGEKKLYIGQEDMVRGFFGGRDFNAKCFVLKKDLISYMTAIKSDYLHPSQDYNGKDNLPGLWEERMRKISELPDFIEFDVKDQTQISGPRGYVNTNRQDDGFSLLREISLPLVSYISTMHLKDQNSDIYYWKLFADFSEIETRLNYIYNYGVKSGDKCSKPAEEPVPNGQDEDQESKSYRIAREGQGKYRVKLLEECPFCPITMINEESLLIASHIKPWAVSDKNERIDPKNGFMLSPLYDKLFDRGFITFSDDKKVQISNWLSRQDIKRIGISNDQFFQYLPIDDERLKYLKFHREFVYKG